MPRNGEEARRRLQQAALELFCERGYEQTTASEIAARAGVTERTFFRHFPDKREVLFDGQIKLRAALTGAIAEAPEALQPLEILYWAFRSVEQALEDNRPFSVPRQQVIANTPALQERELAKAAALTEDLVLALRHRGVDERLATLAAQTGMAAFHYAVASWFADPSCQLRAYLDNAFDELCRLSSPLTVTEARRYQQENFKRLDVQGL
ncbi:helix-turn-helix domain containing protein (plasmid) [Nostoc sp. UHCC 0926]|uniref:TetR/AcrR family transcriptional regulator n=1 Tax=Nostoc sp. UHCC 0926 TaxID=3025190 RepID=UPI00235E3EFA|nr:TetR/AcrR family transcriptional regulator [Nostoc sp. UHCC 0926]WDD37007.1 helix-turn-helix domain containing protein [Nostoc sp. UHCC 0926]